MANNLSDQEMDEILAYPERADPSLAGLLQVSRSGRRNTGSPGGLTDQLGWLTEECNMTEPTNTKPHWMPPRWFVRLAWWIHNRLYRLTSGRRGLRRPRPDQYGLMHLTAIGRRSGQKRAVMLAYVKDGPNLVTLAMNGWDAAEPAWWLNLQANPEAHVELVDGERDVIARVATDEEQQRLWQRWTEANRKLDEFAVRRTNGTAVVILEPAQATA